MDSKAKSLVCRYCGAKHESRETVDERVITQRDNSAFDGLRRSNLLFCKGKGCGGYYQMGCEG